MNNYSVIDIAQLLEVNEETVRRWIRSGRLKSTQTSKKIGNVVNERDLLEFVGNKPKYLRMLRDDGGRGTSDTYFVSLSFVLRELLAERERLNKQITFIQTILGESS